MTFVMVNMTGLPAPGVVNMIELIDLEGNTLYKAPAIMDKKNPFLYHAGPFMPPEGYYFVKVCLSLECFLQLDATVIFAFRSMVLMIRIWSSNVFP